MAPFNHCARASGDNCPAASARRSSSRGAGSMGIGQPVRQQLPVCPHAYGTSPASVRNLVPGAGDEGEPAVIDDGPSGGCSKACGARGRGTEWGGRVGSAGLAPVRRGLVPALGLEPRCPCGRGILSPLRLPFRQAGPPEPSIPHVRPRVTADIVAPFETRLPGRHRPGGPGLPLRAWERWRRPSRDTGCGSSRWHP